MRHVRTGPLVFSAETIPCGGAAAPRGLALAIERIGSRAPANTPWAPSARIKRGVRCADAGSNTRVPKNTPDASRTSRPLNLAFSRKARPEGFTIRCPVWPHRASGLVGQLGPKTLPPGEPFPPRGLSDSRAHDPEGSDRAIHAPLKRLWLQSQNLPTMQIPVDNDSGHPQFSTGFPQGLFARRRLLQAINERGSPNGRAVALSEKTERDSGA